MSVLACGRVQVKVLLDLVSLRKGKLEVAVMLHAHTVDAHNFVNVLQSLNSEADRQAVLDMVDSSGARAELGAWCQRSSDGSMVDRAVLGREGPGLLGREAPPPPAVAAGVTAVASR